MEPCLFTETAGDALAGVVVVLKYVLQLTGSLTVRHTRGGSAGQDL